MTNEKREKPVGLRLAPTLKAAVEQAAKDDSRSMASLIEKLITDYVKERGYLK